MGKGQRSTGLDNRELLHYGYQPINTEVILIGHEKNREEGEKQAKIAVAKNSLKAGVSIDVIAEIIGLSVDYIEKIQEKEF